MREDFDGGRSAVTRLCRLLRYHPICRMLVVLDNFSLQRRRKHFMLHSFLYPFSPMSKIKLSQKYALGIVLIGLTVSGCGTLTELKSTSDGGSSNKHNSTQIDSATAVKAQQESGLSRSQILIRSGMDYLRNGDLEKAQAVFNTALKFDFDNAQLHFLNALTYHQGYLRGDADSFELAKAGYRTALLRDPSLEGIAYLQLGRLFLDAKDHASSKQAFAMAVNADRQSPDALYGLAQTAALDGDLATSYWAVRELDRIKWDEPDLYRLKAIHAALAQQPEPARAWVADYAKSTSDRADAKYLQMRVNQLLAMKISLGNAPSPDGGARPILLAEATPAVAPGIQKPDTKPVALDAAGEASQIPKWFRCDTAPAIPSRTMVNAGAQGASDENITLTPLPAPCPGETPRMALIEVTIIQTEETKGKHLGINLLDGLTGIFTLERARTYGGTNAGTETTTNNFVLANAIDNSIDVLRYSLNIANAAYTRNEVLARPTLAAIDRVPAVFYSGATITLGIAGVGGGTSTIVDKPVGVSLTVTPTFIDDDNILVSMRATRSFLQNDLVPAGSSVLLQQSRNSVSASSTLKFGETFVVSGLIAQQNTLSESGTPILQDIPVLQYLFKNSAKTDSNLEIITMITVRRPPDSAIGAGKAAAKSGVAPHKLSGTVNEFVRLQSMPPVIDEALVTLQAQNQNYRRLRNKDLVPEGNGSKSKLQSILDDFKEMIYY